MYLTNEKQSLVARVFPCLELASSLDHSGYIQLKTAP